MKHILILEDETCTLEYLTEIVRQVSRDVVIHAVNNVKDAYYCAMESTIDLFMVDIVLDTKKPGDCSGLRYVEQIRSIDKYVITPVIMITALEDADRICYEKLHCYSFVEKPFDKKTVQRYVRNCLRAPERSSPPKDLFFRKDGIIHMVRPETIVYVESLSHVLHIYTIKDHLAIPYKTLNKLLQDVESERFLQCSRNTVVNMDYISHVDFTNQYIILEKGYGSVEIGGSFKNKIKRLLGVKK